MNSEYFKEIEDNTYSMTSSYIIEPFYNWDIKSIFDDNASQSCHISGYFDDLKPEFPAEEVPKIIDCDKFKEVINKNVDEENSMVSEDQNSSSTDTSTKDKKHKIYRQLDFILGSVRKQNRVPVKKVRKPVVQKKRKLIRKRKTIMQISILDNELKGITHIKKAQLLDISNKTGLTPGSASALVSILN